MKFAYRLERTSMKTDFPQVDLCLTLRLFIAVERSDEVAYASDVSREGRSSVFDGVTNRAWKYYWKGLLNRLAERKLPSLKNGPTRSESLDK